MKALNVFIFIVFLSLVPSLMQAQEIIDAAKNGDFAKVKELIEKDPQLVNAKDETRRTPLHWAARGVHFEIIQYLVGKGADVNARDSNGTTALHSTASRSHLEACKYLVEKGSIVDVQNNFGMTPLSYALVQGKKELVEFLLASHAKKADLEQRLSNDKTPLTEAANRGNLEMVNFLLSMGANVNSTDAHSNNTPLHFAVDSGNVALTELLLSNGADIGAKNNAGDNPFHRAALAGNMELMKLLLSKGGTDLFKDEANNKRAMLSAIKGGSIEIVKILLAKNIRMDMHADIYGWTMLHYAVKAGKIAMVEFLVAKGFDLNQRNNAGESAYNIAKAMGNSDALSVITKLGGNSAPQKFPALKGRYLGQKTPGRKPAMFAPGIISVPNATEFSGTFSPDGKEYYFYRFSKNMGAKIIFSKITNRKWTNPEPAAFAAGYPSFEPHITFDNKTLCFDWGRPLPEGESGNPNLPGIWVTNRTADGWSTPTYAGQGMFVSSSRDGQVYTTDLSAPTGGYLVKVTINNGRFTAYERLTGGMDALQVQYPDQAHPGIAPDGSYLLFDVGGGNHLFVCFKQTDGTWGEAIDLTHHGFDPMAGGAYVSPDGKYLFFHLNGDLWWVDAKVIENLRPAAAK